MAISVTKTMLSKLSVDARRDFDTLVGFGLSEVDAFTKVKQKSTQGAPAETMAATVVAEPPAAADESDEVAVLKAKLAEQEAENATLREKAAAKRSDDRPVSVEMGEFNGFPTVTLKGPFKPVTLGLQKIVKIVTHIKLIVTTLKKAGHLPANFSL